MEAVQSDITDTDVVDEESSLESDGSENEREPQTPDQPQKGGYKDNEDDDEPDPTASSSSPTEPIILTVPASDETDVNVDDETAGKDGQHVP